MTIGGKPERPALRAKGTVSLPVSVPVAAFAANFSPIPRIAPPPEGRLIEGGLKGEDSDLAPSGPGTFDEDCSGMTVTPSTHVNAFSTIAGRRLPLMTRVRS